MGKATCGSPTRPGDLPLDGWERLACMAELGLLSASLLHELRQPLFAIKAIAQVRRAQDRSIGMPEIDQILGYLRHIDDLFDAYSGLGGAEAVEVRYDLNGPVKRALAMLAHRSKQERINVHAELTEEALLVHGRPAAARQVAVNLIQNALDAVRAREPRNVWVRSVAREGVAELVVQDDGPGVPEHLRSRLGEPFLTTKPPDQGTGLGLFIARRLVEEANGALHIGFPPRGGTRIEVSLPRAA